jgi:hypothetical protein
VLQSRLPEGFRAKWVVAIPLIGGAVAVLVTPGQATAQAKGLLIGAFGVVLVVLFLPSVLRIREWLKRSGQAQGVVVGVEKVSAWEASDGPSYHPRVQFTTPGGGTVVFTSRFGSDLVPDVGEPLRVRYRPDNPDQAEVDRSWVRLLPGALGLLGGVGLLVAGVVVYSP